MCEKKCCKKEDNYKPLSELATKEAYGQVESTLTYAEENGVTITGWVVGKILKLRAKKCGKEPIGSAIFWPHTTGERSKVIAKVVTALVKQL